MILCANPFAQYQSHEREIREAITRVLEAGNYILGAEVAAFEKAFAEYGAVDSAVGVNSGTDALILALRALDVGPGDEVITVSHTALATVAAVIATGATPVLVDVDSDYYTMSPARLAEAVTHRTKAIIPVHIYGQVADLDAIMDIAREHGLSVIEDCSQAVGATYKGRRVGSIGDIGCFSFYPTKNLGAIGDGGMVTSRYRGIGDRVRRLRQYGWNDTRCTEEPGLNSRLDELQAAILSVKLKTLDADNELRRGIARQYDAAFEGLAFSTPSERPDTTHVYHLYALRGDDRNQLRDRLAEHDVFAGVHYPVPAHLHHGYDQRVVLPADGLPVTEALARQVLSMPLYPELNEAEQAHVMSVVQRFAQ